MKDFLWNKHEFGETVQINISERHLARKKDTHNTFLENGKSRIQKSETESIISECKEMKDLGIFFNHWKILFGGEG